MSFTHGKKATLRLGTAAAPTTLSDISDFVSSNSMSMVKEMAETTTYKKNSKTYVAGLRDATIPVDGKFDPTVDTQLFDLYTSDVEVDFEYCPAGTGVVGTPKFTGKCLISSYEVASDVGDADSWSGEFQVTGDVARAIQ